MEMPRGDDPDDLARVFVEKISAEMQTLFRAGRYQETLQRAVYLRDFLRLRSDADPVLAEHRVTVQHVIQQLEAGGYRLTRLGTAMARLRDVMQMFWKFNRGR